MKLKKIAILEGMKKVELQMLDYLKYPRGMRDSHPEDIKAFEEANIISIASNVLQRFKDDPLDVYAFNQFIDHVITLFKKTKASEIEVHYGADEDTPCHDRLHALMCGIWYNMPSVDVLYLITEAKKYMSPTGLERFYNQVDKIKELLETNAEKIDKDDRSNINNQLNQLKQEYQAFMDAEKEKMLEKFKDCQHHVTPSLLSRMRFM